MCYCITGTQVVGMLARSFSIFWTFRRLGSRRHPNAKGERLRPSLTWKHLSGVHRCARSRPTRRFQTSSRGATKTGGVSTSRISSTSGDVNIFQDKALEKLFEGPTVVTTGIFPYVEHLYLGEEQWTTPIPDTHWRDNIFQYR